MSHPQCRGYHARGMEGARPISLVLVQCETTEAERLNRAISAALL